MTPLTTTVRPSGRLLAAFAAAGCLMGVACSDATPGNETVTIEPTDDRTPSTIETAEDSTLYTIEETTQIHLNGVAIGVGNIWEEDYTPPGGGSTRGLTAGLFISVKEDPSQNRTLRVHPGQEVTVPGYRLQVVSVESREIRLAVVEVPE
jgi:hypothetical protein